MPKLYENLGLIILFYSNDHEPIHIPGKYKELESKAEILIEGGVFKEIVFKDVTGKRPFEYKKYEGIQANC